METEPIIKEKNNKKKSETFNTREAAAVSGGIGSVLGAAGMGAVSSIIKPVTPEPEVVVDAVSPAPVVPTEDTETLTSVETIPEPSTLTEEADQPLSDPSMNNTTPTVQPQPELVAENNIQPVAPNEDEESGISGNTGTEYTEISDAPELITAQRPEENIDEAIDELLAIVEIDPNDIDANDIIFFDEVGVLYTEDGEEYLAAAFHDQEGQEMVMIDVDNDMYFDLVADIQGECVIELNQCVSVGDAIAETNDVGTYLAAQEHTEQVMETVDLSNDMLG